MGSARNAINVLSSDVVVACTGGAGTLSEIALALKAGKTVILLDFDVRGAFAGQAAAGRLLLAATPEEAVAEIRRLYEAAPQSPPA
jgi:predicted oxidoreductase